MINLARNKTFRSDLEPTLRRPETTFQLNDNDVSGPFSFFNPTQAKFESTPDNGIVRDVEVSIPAQQQAGLAVLEPRSVELDEKPTLKYKWTSRDNRKGRHTLLVQSTKTAKPEALDTPPPTSHANEVLKGILRMFTTFPVGDISYLVAVIFTGGSLIFILSGGFVFLPLMNPESEFPGEVIQGGGYSAFVGATIFLIGGLLLMLEAINEDRAGCFG